ncbi:MAG: hypothetical protein JXA38_05665 [Methanosarcinaceae archaeon]|nr:hypothetical protein [Methanosarcinaceae archaeon]
MFKCVNYSQFGGRSYQDGKWVFHEEDLVEYIAWVIDELRKPTIKTEALQNMVLPDLFNIDVDGCPDLVNAICNRLASEGGDHNVCMC